MGVRAKLLYWESSEVSWYPNKWSVLINLLFGTVKGILFIDVSSFGVLILIWGVTRYWLPSFLFFTLSLSIRAPPPHLNDRIGTMLPLVRTVLTPPSPRSPKITSEIGRGGGEGGRDHLPYNSPSSDCTPWTPIVKQPLNNGHVFCAPIANCNTNRTHYSGHLAKPTITTPTIQYSSCLTVK